MYGTNEYKPDPIEQSSDLESKRSPELSSVSQQPINLYPPDHGFVLMQEYHRYLELVSRGLDTPKMLASALNLSKKHTGQILLELYRRGLLERSRQDPHQEFRYRLTQAGQRELMASSSQLGRAAGEPRTRPKLDQLSQVSKPEEEYMILGHDWIKGDWIFLRKVRSNLEDVVQLAQSLKDRLNFPCRKLALLKLEKYIEF